MSLTECAYNKLGKRQADCMGVCFCMFVHSTLTCEDESRQVVQPQTELLLQVLGAACKY